MITTDLLPAKLLILGDLIIDKTWYVQASKISPEAPVVVVNLVQNEAVLTPGGAGLAAIYAQKYNIPYVFGSIFSHNDLNLLNKYNINYINLQIVDQNVYKTRYIDTTSGYHLIRVDNDNLINNILDKDFIIYNIEKCINSNNIKGIIVLDYEKSLLSDIYICQEIVKLANKYKIKIYIDTRGNINKFCGANILKLNQKELQQALIYTKLNTAKELLNYNQQEIIIISKAEEGATLFSFNEELNYKAQIPKGIPDVTGAGDVLDVNFCYNYFILDQTLSEAFNNSIDIATNFVYTSLKERLL